jgi:hypothetical protein
MDWQDAGLDPGVQAEHLPRQPGGHGGVHLHHTHRKRGFRARIFKLFRSPRISSKESTTPAYVAWQGGTTTLFLALYGLFKNSSTGRRGSRG